MKRLAAVILLLCAVKTIADAMQSPSTAPREMTPEEKAVMVAVREDWDCRTQIKAGPGSPKVYIVGPGMMATFVKKGVRPDLSGIAFPDDEIVWAHVLMDPSGNVVCARVLNIGDSAGEAVQSRVIEALKQWKFGPLSFNGEAVFSEGAFRFRLKH